ncbi:hypothetical protein C8Q77DRAFT_7941 [Trametes polyzona]|nr:hypothetical protein C8Q77DRAFT_7941 [Trametes polyzona]
MFCCGNDIPAAPVSPALPVTIMPVQIDSSAVIPQEDSTQKRSRGCCSSQPSSRPPSPKAKRHKDASHVPQHAHPSAPALDDTTLPPLFSTSPFFASDTSSSSAPPAFPPIPPLRQVISYAAPECCCGTDCACPGCIKHRGEAHASHDFEDCAEGSCGICVDREGGVELPQAAFAASQGGFTSASLASSLFSPSSATQQPNAKGQAKAGTSSIDAFFARAAALPPPPAYPRRARPGALDPTDVRVYPPDLFAGAGASSSGANPGDSAGAGGARRAAFGLVAIPKLECNCPGGCGCPEGRCACGDECAGCGPGLEDGEEEREGGRPAAEKGEATVRTGGCCG